MAAEKQWAEQIDGELRAGGSAERAAHERAYLKSSHEHYGTSVPAIRAVSKAFRREHPGLGQDELMALVDAPGLVYEWLLPRAARASGVTIREAVKPLSDEQRAAVLAAR